MRFSVLFASAVGLLTSSAGAELITAQDRAVALSAKEATADICSDAAENEVVEDDRERGRDEIQDAMGGDNIVLAALKGPKDKVGETIVADATAPGFIIGAAWPVVLAIIVLIVYFFVICTACPCCKCCRVCRKKDPLPHGMRCKGVLFAALLVALVGILVGGATTMTGYNNAVGGFDTLGCGSATALSTLLSGSTAANSEFIGMIPVLEMMDNMAAQLDTGSQMMTDLNGILDRTKGVEDAVRLVSGALDALSGSLQNPANTNPKLAGEDLIHECQLCADLATPLSEASTALSEGVASAMTDARQSVKTAITQEKRDEMKASLLSSTDSLVSFKKSMVETFKSFFEDGGAFESVRQTLHGQVQLIVMILFILALLLLCHGCISGGCFIKYEHKDGQEFHKTPHRLACCVWSCGCIPIFVGLLVGGIMMVMSVPFSFMCDIMDTLDRQMLVDISPGTGIDVSGDKGDMVLSLTTNCLVPDPPTLNANIMELTFTRNNLNEKVSTAETFKTTITTPVNDAFGSLTTKLDGGMGGLGSSPEITKLRNMLGSNRMSAFYLPMESKVSEPAYAAMMADPSLRAAAVTSMDCDNFLPVGIEGNTMEIPGINDLNTAMDGSGNTGISTGHSCLKTYTCTNNVAACNGAKTIIDFKIKMVSPNKVFQCKRFLTGPGGAPCDLTLMAKDAQGVWQNDCMYADADGLMQVATEDYACNLQEFEDYVKSFDDILGKVFTRLDDDASSLVTGITTDLKNMVDTYLVEPAMEIVGGITCGFMATFYQTMVDGMCFQGVYGLRQVGKGYIVLCIFMLFLAIVMYIAWRRQIDNVNAATAAKKGGQA